MIVFQPNQLIKVQIEEATFWVRALTWQQRQEIMQFKRTVSGQVELDTFMMAKLALKYGLRRAEGLLNPDGSEFKLVFESRPDDVDGVSAVLCDEHCDLLLNCSMQVHALALKLSQGIVIKSQEGVKVTYEGDGSKKKKKTKGSDSD